MNPFFINKKKSLEKPSIVLAMDVSESMLNSQDSALFQASYQKIVEDLNVGLKSQFDVDFLSFDHQIYENEKFSFTGKRTDIGSLLSYVEDKYYMLNLSAIVLLSDGQNNQGISPDYISQKMGVGIYPVVFGDTSAMQDLAIQELYYNKIVRQGTTFPLQVVIQAEGMIAEQIIVQIEHRGVVIEKKSVDISSHSYNKEISFELEAKESGLQGYTVRLVSKVNEKNEVNNVSSFYVQMVESGNQVLILGSSPHPDLGAMASALRSVDGYEVDVRTLNDYPINLQKYQLIILHGLPSNDERSRKILADTQLKTKALWYILSTATDFNQFNQEDISWEISNPNGVYEYAQPRFNDQFTSFQLPFNWSNPLATFPPLYVPFSNYTSKEKSEVMLWQSIRGFESENPLQIFWSKGKRKLALLTGEGLWKWRMYNFQSSGNHDLFNTFVSRSARYLLTGTYDDRFNIQYRNVYNETDLIEWDAQLYNQAYESVSDGQISLEITDLNGHVFPYQFSPETAGYHVNLNYLTAGEYSFEAQAKMLDTVLVEKGKFVVNAWNMEQSKINANNALLTRLAQTSGGEVFYPSQIDLLIKNLNSQPEFKPRASYQQKLINLIDIKWLVVILILLLSSEWILRKRNGTY